MSLINRQNGRLLLHLIPFLNPICLPHALPHLLEDNTKITFRTKHHIPESHDFSIEIRPATTLPPTTFSPTAADTSGLEKHVVLCGLGDRAELYFSPSYGGSIHRAEGSSEAYILFDLSNGTEGGPATALAETIARVLADEEGDLARGREEGDEEDEGENEDDEEEDEKTGCPELIKVEKCKCVECPKPEARN